VEPLTVKSSDELFAEGSPYAPGVASDEAVKKALLGRLRTGRTATLARNDPGLLARNEGRSRLEKVLTHTSVASLR
jgi:hypothetical protein